MPVYIETVKMFDLLRDGPSETTDFLRANIGDKVRSEIDFYIENVAVANADNAIKFRPSTAESGIVDTTRWIWAEDTLAFQNFFVGDVIKASGAVNAANQIDLTIVQKINENLVKVSTDLTAETLTTTNGFIYLKTPMKGIKYLFNLLPNSSATDFASLIDGEDQRASTNVADASDTITILPMPYEGKKSYQSGSVVIKGRGIVLSKYFFKITHEFVVTPTFLAGQYSDLIAGTKPSYYDNAECLKYIFSIQANRDGTNPNIFQEIIYDSLNGNSGWFNENFNGKNTNYNVSDVVITRVSDAKVLTALDLNAECLVTFNVNNTTDTPFIDVESKFSVFFSILPEQSSFYQNNGKTFNQNFVYDSAIQVVGDPSINGDTFGTGYQVFKDVEATFINSGQISVSMKVDIGSDGVTAANLNTNKRYLFAVATEDLLRAWTNSDKVTLLVNVNEFFSELTTADLIEDDHVFIQHPETDRANGVLALQSFPVDDIVANTNFTIDFTGKLTDGIVIKTIQANILARKAGEADILLQNDSFDVSASPLVAGLVQAISVNQKQPYQIDEDSIRTDISIQRETSLDSGNIYGWNINYPFFNRWEFWESIGFVAAPPSGIYDTGEPNNGLNHFWHRYDTFTGWDIFYQLLFTIEQNGQLFQQSFEYQIQTFDYNSNADWINEEIKSFDLGSGLEITNAGIKYLYGYENVRIEASFEHASGIPPIGNLAMVIWIETKEQGGITDIRRASSVYDIDLNSWFKSINATPKVDLSIAANVITGKVLVDFSKLPANSEFTIYARLYDKTADQEGRLLEDGDFRLLEDGDNRLLEDQ